MANWTNKQWCAVIGVVLVFFIAWLGWGAAALAILIGAIGYFVGKFLDGEVDLEDIKARAQGRRR